MQSTYPQQAPATVAVIVTIGVVLLLVWAVWRRYRAKESGVRKGTEFFLMGQRAKFLRVAVSYAATLLSAFTFIGLPGFFYGHGIGTWLFIPFSNICAILLFYFFGRIFRRMQHEFGTYSPFEIVSRAYGDARLGVVAFIVSAIFIIPHLAVQLAGFGKLADSLGWDYQVALLALAVAFVGYTIFAGMEGDVDTDVVQACIMIFGLAVLSWQILWGGAFGTPASVVEAAIDARGESLFSLPGPNGLFTHITLITYVIMFTSVTVVQAPYAMRMLIARGQDDLRRAMIILPWILLAFFLPTAIIGIGGAAIFPDLESGDLIVGKVLLAFFGGDSPLEIGFVSLIVLGLVFAVISTVDSQLLALGATFARDVFGMARRQEQINNGGFAEDGGQEDVAQRTEVVIGRWVMAIVGFGAFLVALSPPELIIQLSVVSVAGTVQMLPMFIGAVLPKEWRPNGRSALASVAVGLLVFSALQWWLTGVELKGAHPGFVGLLFGTAILIAGEFFGGRGQSTRRRR